MKKKRDLLLSGVNAPSMYSVMITKRCSVPENIFGLVLKRFFGRVIPIMNNSKYIKYGFYTRDVAETKIKEITDFLASEDQDLKLKCAVEKQISGVDQG